MKKPLAKLAQPLITDRDADDALKMYEASIPDERTKKRLYTMPPDEIWGNNKYTPPSWIYPRFELFNPAHVGTGIRTQQLLLSIKTCSYAHDAYELPWNVLRPGTMAYIDFGKSEYGKHGSLAGIREMQDAFLRGYDTEEEHWCGLCYERYQASVQKTRKRVA